MCIMIQKMGRDNTVFTKQDHKNLYTGDFNRVAGII